MEQNECNVDVVNILIAVESCIFLLFITREYNSNAALFVNVTANISDGFIFSLLIKCRILDTNTLVLPEPGPAITRILSNGAIVAASCSLFNSTLRSGIVDTS